MNKREKYLHRMESIKAFIRSYWTEHHFSPDTQEIRAALGNLSTSMVSFYRDRLEQEGWLEKSPRPRLPRSFVPTEIFANRPVFPGANSQATQMLLSQLADAQRKLDNERVFDGKIQAGSEMIPAQINDGLDDRHAPMIHYEKE